MAESPEPSLVTSKGYLVVVEPQMVSTSITCGFVGSEARLKEFQSIYGIAGATRAEIALALARAPTHIVKKIVLENRLAVDISQTPERVAADIVAEVEHGREKLSMFDVERLNREMAQRDFKASADIVRQRIQILLMKGGDEAAVCEMLFWALQNWLKDPMNPLETLTSYKPLINAVLPTYVVRCLYYVFDGFSCCFRLESASAEHVILWVSNLIPSSDWTLYFEFVLRETNLVLSRTATPRSPECTLNPYRLGMRLERYALA